MLRTKGHRELLEVREKCVWPLCASILYSDLAEEVPGPTFIKKIW